MAIYLHVVQVDLPSIGNVQIAGTDANRVWGEAAEIVAALTQRGFAGYRVEIRHLRTSQIFP